MCVCMSCGELVDRMQVLSSKNQHMNDVACVNFPCALHVSKSQTIYGSSVFNIHNQNS
jgi:hypothetical protein